MHNKWLGFFALIPSLALVFLDQTILPVALPAIQREFLAENVALQWAVNAYLLTTAMFVLAAGKLADRIGHRKALFFGVFSFGFSSILCSLSPNIGCLIGARALQGMSAAMIYPSQTALLASLFLPKERGRAMGLHVSIGSIFMILAPLVGGFLAQYATWRWIFWINVPIAAIGMWMIRKFVPSPSPGQGKIDAQGFFFFAAAAASATIFFMQLIDWGFSWPSLCFLTIFVVSVILLIRREKKAAHPFLDLKLFKIPLYAAVNMSISITQFIMMVNIFRAIYFQKVLGFSPTESGFYIFLSCSPILFASPIGGMLADRAGAKFPIAAGFLLSIFSFFWLAFFGTPGPASLLIALFALGFGIPLILTPSHSAAMSAVPPQKLGIAFGTISTLRNLTGTMGVALIGLFWDAVQVNKFQNLTGSNSATAHLPASELSQIARGTLPIENVPVSHTLQEQLGSFLREAEIAGFTSTHFALAFLMIVTLAIFFVLYHRKPSHSPKEFFAEGWDERTNR